MTTGVFSLLEMAAKFHAVEADVELVGPAIVARACEMVCKEAKRVLGTYDYDWPSLAPETIARKMKGDSPLLETGELRDSITWTSSGNEGFVGSNSDKAVWQELGTSRGIPPRPFLAGAAIEMESKIHKMAAKAVTSVLSGKGLYSAEMGELIHLLRKVGHAIKELADEDLFKDPDENKGNRR